MDQYLKNWIFKATEDLRAAEHELRLADEEVVTSSVCFHCQQSIEKFLKSFLIYHNKEVKRTHNLTLLQTECSEIEESFLSFHFDNYNNYSVDVRYPDEFYIPTIEEAKEIYSTANQFKDFVLGKIGTTNGHE